MKNLIYFLIQIILINSYSIPTITRKKFMDIYICSNLNFNLNNPKILIISCDKIGFDIANKFFLNPISATTTKPKRLNELNKANINPILIPQMENRDDENFRKAIINNDIIIIADTISIFSIHTYYRTCVRVANAIAYKSKIYPNKKTKIFLISSVNCYGARTDGAEVNELSPIANQILDTSNDKSWSINHYAIALMIRKAEEVLLGIKGTMILRTAMIWNDAIKNEFINFNYKKTYPNSLGKTYISLTTTNKIANIIYKGIQEDLSGIYNIASLPITRKELLEKYINFINWVDNDNLLNNDYYYAIDNKPNLPNCMRFNMIINSNNYIRL